MQPVGNLPDRAGYVGLEGDCDIAGYRGVAGAGLRHVDGHAARRAWHVVLPAAPCDSVALPHQETVAGTHGARVGSDRFDGIVELAQRGWIAAVDHLVEEALVAPVRVNRLEDSEASGKRHQSRIVRWRQIQVGDGLVGSVVRVHCEVGLAVKLLVPAGIAKLRSIRQRLTALDIQAYHRHYNASRGRLFGINLAGNGSGRNLGAITQNPIALRMPSTLYSLAKVGCHGG